MAFKSDLPPFVTELILLQALCENEIETHPAKAKKLPWTNCDANFFLQKRILADAFDLFVDVYTDVYKYYLTGSTSISKQQLFPVC